ncbi:MAG: hypothetical protein QNJ63_07005 [Calothrix sp. MO_192.B10]|nr:hypothetical protein [Calothrix sp. MO_192.B10]
MSFSVVLQAAGGGAIGVGHLSRTATLATALRKTGFWHRVILLWETTPEIAAHFQPPECEVIVVPNSQAAFRERSHLCAEQDSAILVTDLLNVQPQDIVAAKKQGYQAFVHINDSGSGRFLADILVDEDAFKSLKDLPASFEGVGLMGASYRIINQSVVQLRPSAPWQGETVEKVLITLGGADPDNLTLKLVQSLYQQEEHPNLSVTTVVGPAFDIKQVNNLENIAEKKDNFRVVKSPVSLGKLIQEHDLIVTLGGITSYEAMCLGKPCAAIAWGSMKYYIEQLSLLGLLSNLGEVNYAAHHLCEIMKNVDSLHKLARLGWKKIDGQGTERIYNKIYELTNISKFF